MFWNKKLEAGGLELGRYYVELLEKTDAPKFNNVFEWCSGAAHIGFRIFAEGYCEQLCLGDIHQPAIDACLKTIQFNDIENQISVYKSNNFKNIPDSKKFDFIVGNPPFYKDINDVLNKSEKHKLVNKVQPEDFNRTGNDEDWKIHKDFFNDLEKRLTENGVCIVVEHSLGSSVEEFRYLIKNSDLKIDFVFTFQDRYIPEDYIYFLVINKKQSELPEWVQKIKNIPYIDCTLFGTLQNEIYKV